MTAATALRACRLYGIVDLGYVGASGVTRVAREMMAGGVGVIQLRGKDRTVAELTSLASELHEVTSGGGVPLIINDHPEIARAVGAEGVHVGQDDISIVEARAAVGPGCLVGKSTHSEEQALAAAAEGADYIGFGPLFATPTKPTYSAIGLSDIERVHRTVSVPIFCIGGIKRCNLPAVVAAGARRVVIVSELLQATDIAHYARAADEHLNPKSSIENRK
ncbi:MAG: thiamine phosphate synthase [Chthoniobacterales bacterium]|nr:thiamine phosphate synthase [Chthoniobacterales bacterium]